VPIIFIIRKGSPCSSLFSISSLSTSSIKQSRNWFWCDRRETC